MTGKDNESFQRDSVINLSIRNSDITIDENSYEGKETVSTEKNNPKDTTPLQLYIREHREFFTILGYSILHILFGVYFGYATYYFVYTEGTESRGLEGDDKRCHGKCGFQWCNGYGMLIILTSLTYFCFLYYFLLKPKLGKTVHQSLLHPTKHKLRGFFKNRIVIGVAIAAVIVALGLYLYFETQGSEERLIALLCPTVFILTGYIFSANRKAIKWRPVLCGIICQFLLGIFCIRWEVGRSIFQCIGDKVSAFLSYTDEGSKFVFGEDLIKKQVFAFAVLPVIFFFSFCISILYYIGAMQWVITKLGWVLQQILGTTVCESVNAAANIFLGMSESPLLIRPYIKLLTQSELHSIMVSGFATVSGTVLAAYMSFGASPAHLITSSVMAAPATLAFSKLYFPETEESKTKSDNITLEKSQETSLLDAASNGASIAIEIILGIIANLVAFVAFIAFINGVVNWFGYLIGANEVTFEWIFAKLFIPLSWMLGIPWKECDIAAKVIATKTIINEFVAYERLGHYADEGLLSVKSKGIITFAICGFANPSSLGILIGTLGVMAPDRKAQITSLAFRAFIVGSIVCFVSASFAALLMTDDNLSSLAN